MTKGNGKLKGSNGKLKRKKNGRPKAGEGVSKKLLKVTAIKHDGSPTAVAKELGISEPAACKHVNKPEIKEAVLSARAQALVDAGASRVEVVETILEGMRNAKLSTFCFGKFYPTDSPDYAERRKNAELIAKLYGDLTPDQSGAGKSGPPVIMPLILINDVPLEYDFIDIKPNGKD